MAGSAADAESWVPFRSVIQPVAVDGVIYLGGCESEGLWVAACDADSGRRLWRIWLPDANDAVDRLEVREGRVFVADASTGVFVLRAADGTREGLVDTGSLGRLLDFGCSASRVVVAWEGQRWSLELAGFDLAETLPVWRVTLPQTRLWSLAVGADTVSIVRSAPYGPGDAGRPATCERVKLTAAEALITARQAIPAPGDGLPIPTNVPAPVQQRLRKILSRPGGLVLGRTRMEHRGALWYTGSLPDATAPAAVYAIDGRSGAVRWQSAVPGLAALLLDGDQLVAAAALRATPDADPTEYELTALTAETGGRRWQVKLPAGEAAPAAPTPPATVRPAQGAALWIIGIIVVVVVAAALVAVLGGRRRRRAAY